MHTILTKSTRATFLLFLLFALLSHSDGWQQGPFTWAALWLPGTTWQIGPLSLLPLLLWVGLTCLWAISPSTWSWGSWRLTLPLLGITILVLPDVVAFRLVTAVLILTLFWLIYLGLINLHPPQTVWPGFIALCAIVLIVQAVVGMAQFALQHDLGLGWLGEPVLNPAQRGVSIVMNGDVRWLRAYGLNSHPNRLGWKLVLLWLMLWPQRTAVTGLLRTAVWLALALGLAGLLMTLSRSAWLAFGVGLAVYGVGWLWAQRGRWQRGRWQRPSFHTAHLAKLIMPLVAVGLFALFIAFYGGALAGRISPPTNPIETMPVFDRVRDLTLARQLFLAHPWQGVGLGQFVTAAREQSVYAGLVHVVPLLVAAELGIPGLLCWLLLLIAPLARRDLLQHYVPPTAVWLAMITISLLQPEPTMFTMQGALMMGLAAGGWSVSGEQ